MTVQIIIIVFSVILTEFRKISVLQVIICRKKLFDAVKMTLKLAILTTIRKF